MNLKQRLRGLNMTQKELAEITGISEQCISSYCHGTLPSQKNQKILDEVLPEIKKQEPKETNPYGVPLPEAAKMLGMGEQTLREALKQQRVDFGFAVSTTHDRWRYHVSKAKLGEYLGVTL